MLGHSDTTSETPADLIKDGNEASFTQDVIEISNSVPVIVDFWAPWCEPCKQLMPQLEAAVRAAKGRVRLVKVNVDENQALAAQLRIQSLPTVYAFWQGKPADGFQGALSGAEITQFIERAAALGGDGEDGGLADAVVAAEEMLASGAAADAAETFAAILGEDAENAAAYGGVIRAHLALGDTDQAKVFSDNAPASVQSSKELESARAQLELALQAADVGPLAELEAQVAQNPDDHQARHDFATALMAAQRAEEAIGQLLELLRRDREWQEGAARTQLFKIFDALDPKDPVLSKGRRQFSSLMFA